MKSLSRLFGVMALIAIFVVTGSVFAQSAGGTLTIGLAVEPISPDPRRGIVYSRTISGTANLRPAGCGRS